MAVLKIYTDGACSGNQNEKNAGGWGAVLEYGGAIKELSGGESDTTNNRMEMTALIEALSALKKDGLSIDVFSDSSYLMECFRKKWYLSWRKNGWKTAKKTPVENQELWRRLLELTEKHDIRFYRVKGHVNPDSPNAGLNGLYRKFTEWNGKQFSMDDFIYITGTPATIALMNWPTKEWLRINRADKDRSVQKGTGPIQTEDMEKYFLTERKG